MPLVLKSSAFDDGDLIPDRHTCDDADFSPPLAWSGVPEGTQSFAVALENPDVPHGTWTHWLLYDIPPGTDHLSEWVLTQPQLLNGALQGMNDFGFVGYNGPCEQSSTHTYVFTLFALDSMLDVAPGIPTSELKVAMKGHVLDTAKLSCTYITNL